jgi:hypothetical protein
LKVKDAEEGIEAFEIKGLLTGPVGNSVEFEEVAMVVGRACGVLRLVNGCAYRTQRSEDARRHSIKQKESQGIKRQ